MSEIIKEIHSINELPLADDFSREEIKKIWEVIQAINTLVNGDKND